MTDIYNLNPVEQQVFDAQFVLFNKYAEQHWPTKKGGKKIFKPWTAKDAIDLGLHVAMTDPEIEEIARDIASEEGTALCEDEAAWDRGDFDDLHDYDDAWC